MPTLYLIRHARPAAGWGQDPDPGLDETGHEQAKKTALAITAAHRSMPIYSSPLKRCRETAAPLIESWARPLELMPAVAEIPSPPLGLKERSEWLAKAMSGTWQELQASAPANSPDYSQWRAALVARLAALESDCVIYTHFVAINVAVSAAQGSDAVICFRPDHASVTSFTISGGHLRLLELGRQADTSVLIR
jgi:broad specificity phosphatase PhoE